MGCDLSSRFLSKVFEYVTAKKKIALSHKGLKGNYRSNPDLL